MTDLTIISEGVEGEGQVSSIRPADVDPVNAWIEEIILEHTPLWAMTLAWLCQIRGLRWLQAILPLVRKLTDLEVKTETNIKGGTGFRPGTTSQKRTLRIYKRGIMIAEKAFPPVVIRNSPYGRKI